MFKIKPSESATRQIRVAYESGELDPVEHVAAYLDKIEKSDINAFITVDKGKTIQRAERLKKKGDKEKKGALFGLAIGIKDNIAVRGLRMTCGSRMLENYSAPYNATIVDRLIAEDAIIIGKCNMDEFACGASGETSFFGPTKNPRDKERVAGGSSSGSGASLAANECDLSIGSDTGGSVRCPASFCGVTALKPSYGLVSRYGLADMCMSLEGPAPMAKANDTYGCALLLETMAGFDEKDCMTIKKKRHDFTSRLDELDVSKITFGVAKEFFDGVDESVGRALWRAIQLLESEGAQRRDLSIPALKYSLPVYYLIVYGEFASAMQKYDGYKYGNRENDTTLSETMAQDRTVFGDEVKRRILFGTYITMKEYREKWYSLAIKGREALKAEFASAMKGVDFLVCPTNPSPAFRIGEKIQDPVAMYLSDVLTTSVNLTKLPAGVVPAALTPLPVGMQIIGKYGEDEKVLQLMRAYEKVGGAA